MNNLPNNTPFLVLDRTGENGYKLWHRTGLVTITSRVPLKIGCWFIRDGARCAPLLSQPFNPCTMSRKNNEMIRLSVVVVRPLPSYFETGEGQLKRRFMNYLGVSCGIGIVFIPKKFLEEMECGVPYEMFVASFGTCHSPEDEIVLKAMKSLGTVWVATKQQLVRCARIPNGKRFVERMMNEGVELLDFPDSSDISSPGKKSPCRPGTSSPPRNENTGSSIPCGAAPCAVSNEVHPVNPSTANDIVWNEESPKEVCPEQPKNQLRVAFDSEEGKAKTRACLEKVVNNLRIQNAFIDAGYSSQLASLKAILPKPPAER